MDTWRILQLHSCKCKLLRNSGIKLITSLLPFVYELNHETNIRLFQRISLPLNKIFTQKVRTCVVIILRHIGIAQHRRWRWRCFTFVLYTLPIKYSKHHGKLGLSDIYKNIGDQFGIENLDSSKNKYFSNLEPQSSLLHPFGEHINFVYINYSRR